MHSGSGIAPTDKPCSLSFTLPRSDFGDAEFGRAIRTTIRREETCLAVRNLFIMGTNV